MMFGLFSVDASGRQSKVVRGNDDTKREEENDARWNLKALF